MVNIQLFTIVAAFSTAAVARPSLPLSDLNGLTAPFLQSLASLTNSAPPPPIPDVDLAPETCNLGILSQPLCCEQLQSGKKGINCAALPLRVANNKELISFCSAIKKKAACCAGTLGQDGALCSDPASMHFKLPI